MSKAIHPILLYVIMAWCLVKHRDKFTFTFIPSHYCFITTNNINMAVSWRFIVIV